MEKNKEGHTKVIDHGASCVPGQIELVHPGVQLFTPGLRPATRGLHPGVVLLLRRLPLVFKMFSRPCVSPLFLRCFCSFFRPDGVLQIRAFVWRASPKPIFEQQNRPIQNQNQNKLKGQRLMLSFVWFVLHLKL